MRHAWVEVAIGLAAVMWIGGNVLSFAVTVPSLWKAIRLRLYLRAARAAEMLGQQPDNPKEGR